MIKKVILSQVDFYDKNKDGSVLTYKAKDGTQKRYKKIRIGIQGMQDKVWGAIWDSKSPLNTWEPEMEVTIDIEQDAQGYWHFKLPNKDSGISERIQRIEERLDKLEKDMYVLEEETPEIPMENLEEQEIKPEDLPF